jgi:hypothetical protein
MNREPLDVGWVNLRLVTPPLRLLPFCHGDGNLTEERVRGTSVEFRSAMPIFAMKTKLLQMSAIAALAFAPFTFECRADAPPLPGSIANPAPSETQTNQFEGKITAVDREMKTVTLNDKNLGSHKLQLDDSTKISKGAAAESASFEDLKVGADVQGTCKKSGDMFRAETLKVSSSGEAK